MKNFHHHNRLKRGLKKLHFRFNKEQSLGLGLMLVMVFASQQAYAFTAPTPGSAFYEIWDVVYNSAFKGSIGNLVALLGVGLGTWQSVTGDWKKGMGSGVGVAGFAKADSIIQTLGVSVVHLPHSLNY